MMLVTLTLGEDSPEYSLTDDMPAMMSITGLFGVCVPNACEATFVDLNFEEMDIKSEKLYCREANDKPMATQDIVAVVVFSILGLLLVLSTGYHLTSKLFFNKDVSKIAKSFSVHHNMTRLVNIPKSRNHLSCVYGIRALSMGWVILAHAYQTVTMVAMENSADAFTWLTLSTTTMILSASLAVDTFLYLAAFLMTWSVLKKFHSPVPFTKSIPLLYLSRYLRLTPVQAAVILLQISFFNHVGDGPDWRPVTLEVDLCLENWWVNFLYLQNYLRPRSRCLGHTWYLAVDMQLYLAAPILLVFLFMNIKFAIASLTIVSLASLGAALGYCFYYNYNVMFGLLGTSDLSHFMEHYYMNTIHRSAPFVLGIFVAYIIFTLKKRNVTISNKFYIAFHCIMTTVLLVSAVYGTYTTFHYDHSQETINFFNAWHRPAWALGVGGVIVACMHGFAGPVEWFLSLDIWIIPARLSYAMYLIHIPIMMSTAASQKSPRRFSDSIVLVRFVSDLGIALVAALFLNMIVEAPFAELTNLLFAKLTGPNKVTQSELTSKAKDEASSSLHDGRGKQEEMMPSVKVMNERDTANHEG